MAASDMQHSWPGSRGATLLELVTVVALMGIIAATAYSSLQPYAQQYRVKAAAVTVAAELNRARQDAIRTRLCHFYVPDGGTRLRIVRDDPSAPNCQLAMGDSDLRIPDMSAQFPSVSFSAGGISEDPYGGAVAGPTPANLRFEPRGLVTAASGSTIFVNSASYGPVAVTVSTAGAIRTWRRDGGTWQ